MKWKLSSFVKVQLSTTKRNLILENHLVREVNSMPFRRFIRRVLSIKRRLIRLLKEQRRYYRL